VRPSKPDDQIGREREHLALRAVVDGLGARGVVEPDFGTEYEPLVKVMSNTKGVLEVGGLVAGALALEVVEDVGPKDGTVKFVFDPGAVLRCGSGELFAQEKQGLARSMASGIMKMG
jgi:hypothetical protein